MTRVLAAAVVLLTSACAARAQQDTGTVVPADLPPAGFGTLKQEDIALRIQTATVSVRVLPLDERILRLLAPDTYASLHRLRASRDERIAQIGEQYGVASPTAFLVTFFGRQDHARFVPEILSVMSQNRFFRPLEILPLTPLWSRRQLEQRETASAVYVFEEIRVLDPFTLSYEEFTSEGWEQTLRTLDRERASVLARAAQRRR